MTRITCADYGQLRVVDYGRFKIRDPKLKFKSSNQFDDTQRLGNCNCFNTLKAEKISHAFYGIRIPPLRFGILALSLCVDHWNMTISLPTQYRRCHIHQSKVYNWPLYWKFCVPETEQLLMISFGCCMTFLKMQLNSLLDRTKRVM